MTNAGPYYRPPGMGGRPRESHFPWLPVIIGVVLIAVAVILLLVFAYPGTFGISGPSYPSRYGLFGGFFALFFILIVVFFVVRVAFWSARAGRYGRRYNDPHNRGPPPGYGPNRPEMVARMRYARGEITREQYEQIMKDLGRPPPAP